MTSASSSVVIRKQLKDHFDRSAELERRLVEKGRGDWLQSVARLREAAAIFSVRQREQLGLGHAVLQAKHHVGDEPFLCLLGDTIFSGDPSPTRQLLDAHEKPRRQRHRPGARRPREGRSNYGIAGGTMLDDATMRIDTLVEKPAEKDAPSDLAIAARYALSPTLFSLLEETKPGAGGEIQLTDALRELCRRETVHGVVLQAARHDIGDPDRVAADQPDLSRRCDADLVGRAAADARSAARLKNSVRVEGDCLLTLRPRVLFLTRCVASPHAATNTTRAGDGGSSPAVFFRGETACGG